jgi:hypothetical protein
MKLREIFEHLAYSELSQLNVGDTSLGLINESNYDKVLSAVNLGLTALHTRFCLKQNEAIIDLIQGKYSYVVPKDDLLKVEIVYTDSGYELPLNDASQYYSVMTPNLKTLNVPKDIVDGLVGVPEEYAAGSLKLVYRANHKIMPYGFNGYDADLVEIDLPYAYVEPLLYFIGSRFHNPMGLINDFNVGNNYAAKYERACQEIEKSNIRVDQGKQNTRLTMGGWV